MTENSQISVEDAAQEVALVCRRMALLHIAFARTLVERLGEEQGKELIVEAIRSYGQRIGEEVRDKVEQQGLSPTPENYGAGTARQLPAFGMHDEVKWTSSEEGETLQAFGCVMGKVWDEMGEGELGRLYCLVDPAKFLAYDGKHTLAHRKTIPDGNPHCEFCIREATPEELEAFSSGDGKWTSADECGV